jgi:putative PIN family toxin of toxin-antitoxin system
MIPVVLDTNVVVSALISDQGASFRILELIGPNSPFRPVISVPLLLEYEMVLKRMKKLRAGDIDRVLDYLCVIGDLREIYYLWRPFLRDPKDEMVLEVAVSGSAEVIVTHNASDFVGVKDQFGIDIVSPGGFLLRLRREGKL